MSYHLRPAITTEAKPLIGLYSESGKGKTKSALLLAKGFCGDMSKVAMIETESGRGEVYASDPVVGGYLVRPIRDNFAPSEYGKALTELEQADIKVAIIDSASHEWEGSGGVLSWATRNQEEGKKGVLVWQQPKMSHQRDFILRLLQTPIALVIVCMRAKYPMKESIKDGRKEWVKSEIVEPKQSDDILFEMMVHGWIDEQHRLHVTKYTTDAFRKIFIDNQPITVATGKQLAVWATGSKKQEVVEVPEDEPERATDVGKTSVVLPPPEESPTESPTEEGMTEADVMADLEKAGMVNKPEPPPVEDDKVREAKLLNLYAKEIAKMPDTKALNAWFTKNRLSMQKEFSVDGYGHLVKLVNDKSRSWGKK